MTTDLVVIGGGPAGVAAALRASELGARVALVEAGRLGGTCVNDGCVPVRALARAARLRREMEGAGLYGLSGGTSLDFGQLMTRCQQVVYDIHEKKQWLRQLETAGVRVYESAGEARFVDAHTLSAAALRLAADRFIICAGGRPGQLPFEGAEHALTYGDIWRLRKLPESLVIVGGAATGCQVASVFAAFGSHVTLVELTPRLLPAEDEAISRAVQAAFEARGIQIRTVSAVTAVQLRNGRPVVSLTSPAGRVSIEAQAVIVAAGWPGNLDSLNLPAAGVEVRGRYISVDEQLRTSVSHIYAAGDITGRMMLAPSAGFEGRVAAENAVLGSAQRAGHLVVPHGGFTDPEYGSVGLTESQARARGGCVVAEVAYAELDRAVIDGLPHGVCKLIASAQTGAILGAHVAGEQAVEVVQMAAVAMAGGMTVEQLARLELAYPTYTALLSLAAQRLVEQSAVQGTAGQAQGHRSSNGRGGADEK